MISQQCSAADAKPSAFSIYTILLYEPYEPSGRPAPLHSLGAVHGMARPRRPTFE